eukprot:TRINITY_DN85238_c0_g1_i1.p1 TRINITY_DN85238_c0_g1~~TRINITY_DN85238_c0_g1_i1.p1  ORF type:complete len:483 (-),score=142.81 TRINITY_DN85238_c0_g1_i1:27-1475(-)
MRNSWRRPPLLLLLAAPLLHAVRLDDDDESPEAVQQRQAAGLRQQDVSSSRPAAAAAGAAVSEGAAKAHAAAEVPRQKTISAALAQRGDKAARVEHPHPRQQTEAATSSEADLDERQEIEQKLHTVAETAKALDRAAEEPVRRAVHAAAQHALPEPVNSWMTTFDEKRKEILDTMEKVAFLWWLHQTWQGILKQGAVWAHRAEAFLRQAWRRLQSDRVLGVGIAAVASILVLWLTVSWAVARKIQSQIERLDPDSFGMSVKVQSASGSMLRGCIWIDGLTVCNPSSGTFSETLLKVERTELRLSYFGLLMGRRPVEIESVEMQAVELVVEQHPDLGSNTSQALSTLEGKFPSVQNLPTPSSEKKDKRQFAALENRYLASKSPAGAGEELLVNAVSIKDIAVAALAGGGSKMPAAAAFGMEDFEIPDFTWDRCSEETGITAFDEFCALLLSTLLRSVVAKMAGSWRTGPIFAVSGGQNMCCCW